MAKKKEIMLAMYDAGMTYQKIGEVFGVSRQAVHQMINGGDGLRLSTLMKIPYVGLRRWMLENRVTQKELNKRTGLNVRITKDSNLSMKAIPKIINTSHNRE